MRIWLAEGRLWRETSLSSNLPKRPRDRNQLGNLIVDTSVGEAEDHVPTPEDEGKDPAASLWADAAARRGRGA